MKKIILLSTICFLFASPILSQSNYPKAGSPDWEKLSVKEKVSSCQIYSNELKNMTSTELIDKCLDYPFILSIFFFEDFQKGFEHVKRTFNGLTELFNRGDAAVEIFNKYKGIKADQIDEVSFDLRPDSYD